MAPAELDVESAHPSLQTPRKAKAYNRTKLTTGIASAVLSFVVLLLLVLSGSTRSLESWVRSWTGNDYVALLGLSFIIWLVQSVVTVPVGFYSGYIVEHRYHLSNQSVGRWVFEHLKGIGVSFPIIVAVILFLYYCLQVYSALWWIPVSLGRMFLSIVLARIAPVILLPIFYKLTPLEDSSLKQRIVDLCRSANVRVMGVFRFNLSKNTRKANAAFTGIGRSRRIILGDTLLNEFSEEEIETIFAHEVGHYAYHHIRTGILISMMSTCAGLYVTAQLYSWSVGAMGFSSLTSLAALPLLALWLSIFGLVTMPLGNMVSRRHERQADSYAVRKTGKKEAFVAALRRLEQMNLADPDPHPLVEFLFFSHPSIARRIRAVEALAP